MSPFCLGDAGLFQFCLVTLHKANIAPENGWLEDEFPLGFRPIFSKETWSFTLGGPEIANHCRKKIA